MLRTLSKPSFIVALFSAAVANAQTPTAPPLQGNYIDTQHFFAGITAGLFDGLTTSWSTGVYGGWVGPARTFRQIGGIAPEVSFSLQYINKTHLERLRYMPDAIARDAIFASVVAGPRIGEQLGFRTLVGLGFAGGRVQLNCPASAPGPAGPDWILLARTDGEEAKPAAAEIVYSHPFCGKNDRRFPFVAELGPDLELKRFRLTLPVVITRFGDRDTRTQYSLRFGVDIRLGVN